MALMKCSECGNELNNEDIVCAKCGCLVEENGNNSNDSKKEVESCISETEKKNNSDIKTTNKRKMVSCAIVLILLV